VTSDDERPTPPAILDASGKPARQAIDTSCPQCGAGPEKRVLSGGFGPVHDVCGQCGHDFAERTL